MATRPLKSSTDLRVCVMRSHRMGNNSCTGWKAYAIRKKLLRKYLGQKFSVSTVHPTFKNFVFWEN